MRRLLVAALVLASTPAAAQPAAPAPAERWLCLPGRRGPIDPCPKGAALDETFVRACRAEVAGRRKRPARVRVDGGAWVELPRRGWRCLALPATAPAATIEIENYGRVIASWKLRLTGACRGGTYDLEPGNFYGASYAACSRRRDHRRDEHLP